MNESAFGSFSEEEIFYLPRLAQVAEVRPMSDTEVRLRVDLGLLQSFEYNPGQFVQLAVLGVGEAPLSLCSSPTRKDGFELCVRAAGSVTKAIHRLTPGAWVGIRGPYGRGFPVHAMKGKDLLVVAAGLGIAPLRSLVAYALDSREDYGRLIVVYGTRKEKDILFSEEVEAWCRSEALEMYLTLSRAEESWGGRKGRPTEPLREIVLHPTRTIAAVAGPPGIYRYVAIELFKRGWTQSTSFAPWKDTSSAESANAATAS